MGWSVEETVEFYKSYADRYDQEISEASYPAPFLISSWIIEQLLKTKTGNLRILDVGCGTGQRYFSSMSLV